LSSPSTPNNSHNQNNINHFPQKNSWHSSYAPLDTINIWIKDPSRDRFDRAEINSRRSLAPLFLNRISRTESMFYPQLPQESSFWRSPRSRHSGAARISVLAFVALLHLQGNRFKPHRINILSATLSGSIFCRSPPAKASFPPVTIIF